MKSISMALALCLGSLSSAALAGVCEIKTVRVACSGKDAESFSKCGGKAECSSKKKAATVEECQKIAAKECENSRTDVTKSKAITATFDGKETSVGGKPNFCDDARPDFNKCK